MATVIEKGSHPHLINTTIVQLKIDPQSPLPKKLLADFPETGIIVERNGDLRRVVVTTEVWVHKDNLEFV